MLRWAGQLNLDAGGQVIWFKLERDLWFRDGVGGACYIRMPFTGPCVIEDQGLGNGLHISCTLEKGYCDLVSGFDNKLVQFRVVGRLETFQRVE